MKKETYEALKRIIKEREPNFYGNTPYEIKLKKDFKQVKNWVDEAEKDIN